MGEINKQYVFILFQNILTWYENADRKAQIILGFNAAFVSFIVGILLSKKSDELKVILNHFSSLSWLLIYIAVLCIMMSIIFCFSCLRSRLKMNKELIQQIQSDSESNKIKAEYIWYFGFVRLLENKNFIEKMRSLKEDDVIEAFSCQCKIVSQNVYEKHTYINYSLLSSVTTLFAIILLDITYMYQVSNS